MRILYVDPVVYVDSEGRPHQAFVGEFDPGMSTQSLIWFSVGDTGWLYATDVPQSSPPARDGDALVPSSWFALPGARTVRLDTAPSP